MVERIYWNQFIRESQPFWRGTTFIDAARAFPHTKSLWDLSLEIKSAQLETRVRQLESRNSQLTTRISQLTNRVTQLEASNSRITYQIKI